jgi:hypothetical protein
MSTYVTPQGLQIPTVQGLLDLIAQEQRSTIDPLLNTDPDSPQGQLNGIFASHLREAWEALGVAYNGNNPDAAEAFLLEALSAITGTKRAPATRSKFVGARKLTVNLNAGTDLPIGTSFHVAGDPLTLFATSEKVKATAGTGNYLVSALCTVTGPVTCNAGTLTVIASPVVGLNSVTNTFDAEIGSTQDNDPQLRIRREKELRATGSGTVDSIRADLAAYEDASGGKPILDVNVFENTSDAFDANGLPPHSIECLVFDGVSQSVANDAIAQVIWESKPGGIPTVGGSTGNATDSLGTIRPVAFSRPLIDEVIFKATLTLTNANQIPSQYAALVKAAIVARFAVKVRMGSVIRCNHYEAAITDIPGIEDCLIQVGFLAQGLQAVDVNLALGTREMGFVQTSGITVV